MRKFPRNVLAQPGRTIGISFTRFQTVALAIWLVVALFFGAIYASAATLTQAAIGGAAISSDTAVNGGSNTATTLGPIEITEAAAGEISSGTLIFQLPHGFQWDTTSVPSAATEGSGCAGLTFGTATFASSSGSDPNNQVRIPVTAVSTAPCVAVFGEATPFKVKPTNRSPIPEGGHIFLSTSGSAVTGLQRGPDGTDLGTIEQVAGSSSASTSTVVASPTSVLADGNAESTITVTLKDAGGNPIAGKTIVLVSNRASTDTISPASATTDASGVATFEVSSSTTGSATFTATNTTDSVTISQTATVTFTGPADKDESTVTAVPSTVAADGNAAATVTVALKDASGNPVAGESVTLTSSRGSADNISPASGVSNSSGTVTFSVTSTTEGTATFSATVDSVTLDDTADVTFGFAGAPTLNSPANGAQLNNLGPLLDWTNPANTHWFQIQVIPFNDDGPGINLIIGDPVLVAASEYQVLEPDFDGSSKNFVMLPGMSYTWRVRAASTLLPPVQADWGPWSEVRSFKTATRSSATISRVSPTEAGTVSGRTPTLVWDNSDDTVFYYEVQVSKDANFGSGTGAPFLYWELRHGGVTNPLNSYTIPGQFPLEGHTTYFWRVRPRVQGDGTPVAWSSASSFRTQ